MKVTYDSIPGVITKILEKVKQMESILEAELTNKGHYKTRAPGDQGEALTIDQASKILRISKATLYYKVRHKKVPFLKKGRRLYFFRNDLSMWEKSRNESSAKLSEPVSVKDPDWITVREAVKLLKLPTSRVYYTIRSKDMPVIAREGNRLYFSKRQLIEAFAEETKDC